MSIRKQGIYMACWGHTARLQVEGEMCKGLCFSFYGGWRMGTRDLMGSLLAGGFKTEEWTFKLKREEKTRAQIVTYGKPPRGLN